jgi:hypothetical protein
MRLTEVGSALRLRLRLRFWPSLPLPLLCLSLRRLAPRVDALAL